MIVFVHGVPESAALWSKVQDLLDAESVALALPGFGNPRPDGFGATKDEYVDWLVGELETFDGPVDLVGHDWGAALTYRVATTRGDLLRSWAADVANVMHPDYRWHDFAQIWQTPGAGEEFMSTQAGVPLSDLAEGYEALGIPADGVATLVPFSDAVMASCILDLYRSATPRLFDFWGDRPGPDLGARAGAVTPSDDPFGDERCRARWPPCSVPATRRCPASATGGRSRIRSWPPPCWPPSTPRSADRGVASA